MKCQYCDSEWQLPKTVQVLICPFCHNPLMKVSEIFDNLEDVLLYLVNRYGVEILLDRENILQFIEHHLTGQKREYNFMNMVYSANIVESLYRVRTRTEVIQKTIIKQAVIQLCDRYGVAKDWSEYVIGCISKCFGITEVNDSIIKIKQQAENQNAKAQYELAERYYSGREVKRNLVKYIYWLKCSAQNGYCDAVFKLGKELYDGINCEKNEIEGLKLISQAALNDNLAAVCFLICNTKRMHLNIVSEKELLKRIESSKERMATSHLVELAAFFRDNGDVYNAIDFAKKAYELDAKMAWEIYMSLLQMEDFVKNKATVLKVLREMATNGNRKAAKILGNKYENEARTESDMLVAIYWYRFAADMGDVDTQIHLGQIYEQGLGIKADLDQAIYWYRIASYNGSNIAHKKVSYKSKECIIQDLTVILDDDSEVVYKVKGTIAFQGKDYLIISDYETQEEFVLYYVENHSLEGFDIEGVDEEIEEVVLRLFGGERSSAS